MCLHVCECVCLCIYEYVCVCSVCVFMLSMCENVRVQSRCQLQTNMEIEKKSIFGDSWVVSGCRPVSDCKPKCVMQDGLKGSGQETSNGERLLYFPDAFRAFYLLCSDSNVHVCYKCLIWAKSTKTERKASSLSSVRCYVGMICRSSILNSCVCVPVFPCEEACVCVRTCLCECKCVPVHAEMYVYIYIYIYRERDCQLIHEKFSIYHIYLYWYILFKKVVSMYQLLII